MKILQEATGFGIQYGCMSAGRELGKDLCIVILTPYTYTVHIPGTCYFLLVLSPFSCWQQSYACLVPPLCGLFPISKTNRTKDTSFLFVVMTNIHWCIKNTCTMIMVCECMGLSFI